MPLLPIHPTSNGRVCESSYAAESERGTQEASSNAMRVISKPKTVTPPEDLKFARRPTRSTGVIASDSIHSPAPHFASFGPITESSSRNSYLDNYRKETITTDGGPPPINVPEAEPALRSKRPCPFGGADATEEGPLSPKRQSLLQKLTISSPRTNVTWRSPPRDFRSDILGTPRTFSNSSPFHQAWGHGQKSPFNPLPPRFQVGKNELGEYGPGRPRSNSLTASRQVPVTILSENRTRLSHASNGLSYSAQSICMKSSMMRSLGHEDYLFSSDYNPRTPNISKEVRSPPGFCTFPGMGFKPIPTNRDIESKHDDHRRNDAISDAACVSGNKGADLDGFDGLTNHLSTPNIYPKYSCARNLRDQLGSSGLKPIKQSQQDFTVISESRTDESLFGNGFESDVDDFILGLPHESHPFDAHKRCVSSDEGRAHSTMKSLKLPPLLCPPSVESSTSVVGPSFFPMQRSELSLHSFGMSDFATGSDMAGIEQGDSATPPPILASPASNNQALTPPPFLPNSTPT